MCVYIISLIFHDIRKTDYLCRASREDMSIGVRRPRVFLRYHRGPVTALEAQQPFGCVSIQREFLPFALNDRLGNNSSNEFT